MGRIQVPVGLSPVGPFQQNGERGVRFCGPILEMTSTFPHSPVRSWSLAHPHHRKGHTGVNSAGKVVGIYPTLSRGGLHLRGSSRPGHSDQVSIDNQGGRVALSAMG